MFGKYKFMNRLRPSTTAPELLFSPDQGNEWVAKLLYVVNLDNKERTFSIYYDHNGSTTDETTAIAFESVIEANTSQPIELDLPLRNSDGGIYVEIDQANDINFQLMGDQER